MRKRGHYDRETIDAILDAGLICHVGFVVRGAPFVIPTLFWREGDHVYLHGSIASRMLDTAHKARVCVTVTHVDALVLTRSAFHHSVNYRSVVILGKPEEVTDPAEKEARLRTFMEGLMPGRWDRLRPVKPKELKATRLLRPADRRGLGEDPLRPAGRRQGGPHLAGMGRTHPDRNQRGNAAAGRAHEGHSPGRTGAERFRPSAR